VFPQISPGGGAGVLVTRQTVSQSGASGVSNFPFYAVYLVYFKKHQSVANHVFWETGLFGCFQSFIGD